MAARADVSRSKARAWHLLGGASDNDGCRCRFLKPQTSNSHSTPPLSLPVGLSHGAAAASRAAMHTPPPRRCSPPLICSVHRCTRAGATRSGCACEAAGCASRWSHMAARGGGAALWTARRCGGQSRARAPLSARARALAPVRSGRSTLCGAARPAFTARVRRRRHHRRSPPPRVAAAAHHERSTAAGARCRSSRRLARFTAAGADANGRFWRGWRGTARRSVLHAGSADGAVGGAQARRLASCGGAKPHRVWVNRASAAGARRGLRRC